MNTKQCPLCGENNHCGAQQTAPCWCTQVTIPRELIALVPEPLLHKACICQSCVESYHDASTLLPQMIPTAKQLRGILLRLGDPQTARHSARFFKTAPGEYGEGDRFLGIRVPTVRKQVALYWKMPLDQVLLCLHSPFHEERLFAALVLVKKYEKGPAAEQQLIFDAYVQHARQINNWDLVDTSAPQVIGGHLMTRERNLLYQWATSDNLWERRIAIMATFTFIRHRDFKDALAIADLLLHDREDLIHKAVGWMLREIGNRSPETERSYLKTRAAKMPRTMLRYAIEKFPEAERQTYLTRN